MLKKMVNMCFGCSKEPSQWDGSFEYPQHVFWLRNKKNHFQIRTLIWRPGCRWRLGLIYISLALLETSAWVPKGGCHTPVISSKVSWVGPNVKRLDLNSVSRIYLLFACWVIFAFVVLCWLFKINFKKILSEHYQSVQRFGSISGQTICPFWSESKLFCKGNQQTTKAATSKESFFTPIEHRAFSVVVFISRIGWDDYLNLPAL